MANKPKVKKTTRISVTISTELYDLLNELSASTGKSAAHFPAIILEENKPTIKALIDAYETAKNDKKKAFEDMTLYAEQALAKTAGVISRD